MTFFFSTTDRVDGFSVVVCFLSQHEKSFYDENLESIFINQSFHSKLKGIFYAAKELRNFQDDHHLPFIA